MAIACAGIHTTIHLELEQGGLGKDCIGFEHGVALLATRVLLGGIAGKEVCTIQGSIHAPMTRILLAQSGCAPRHVYHALCNVEPRIVPVGPIARPRDDQEVSGAARQVQPPPRLLLIARA